MRSDVTSKESYIWLLLMLLTLLTWLMIESYRAEQSSPIGPFIVIVAFIKARLVVMYFMEILGAPGFLRAFMEAWVVFTCSSILVFLVW